MTVIQECVDRMRGEIVEALRHKGPQQMLSLEFHHDVFKYLFNGKGKKSAEKNWTLYKKKDFVQCTFPLSWNCLFDKDAMV